MNKHTAFQERGTGQQYDEMAPLLIKEYQGIDLEPFNDWHREFLLAGVGKPLNYQRINLLMFWYYAEGAEEPTDFLYSLFNLVGITDEMLPDLEEAIENLLIELFNQIQVHLADFLFGINEDLVFGAMNWSQDDIESYRNNVRSIMQKFTWRLVK